MTTDNLIQDPRHYSVLLGECIDNLNIKPDGIYCDCTAGGGGHSKAIADKLSAEGKLVMIDRDPDAINNLREKFASYNNVIIIKNGIINTNHKRFVLAAFSLFVGSSDLITSSFSFSTLIRYLKNNCLKDSSK